MEIPNASATQTEEPFWFLENADNPESRLAQADFVSYGQQTQRHPQETENWYTDKSNLEEKYPKESNKLDVEDSASKQDTDQSKPVEDAMSDLERSLFGDGKEKGEKAYLVLENHKGSEKQQPTVHEISSNKTTINLDLRDLIDNQKNPKIIIKVKEENDKSSGEERIIEINASSIANELLSVIANENGKKPKINMPVDSNAYNTATNDGSHLEINKIERDNLLSDQKTQILERENDSFAVVKNTESNSNNKPKTVIIAVQNGRKGNLVPENRNPFDIFESFSSDFKALESSFNKSNISNANSGSRVRPFQNWAAQTRTRGGGAQEEEVDWVEETQDTWHRADGARCTRTVTVTPGGRSVKTRCSKDGDRPQPQQQSRRRRNVGYPLTQRGFLTDADDELNYYLNRARRMINRWF